MLTCIGLLVACKIENPLASPIATQPPTPTPEPRPTSTPTADSVSGFRQFLAEANASQPSQRSVLVNRYLALLEHTPITEGETAVFFWQGSAQSVQLVGDMNNWSPENAPALTRLEGTDLWFLEAIYEPEARLDYKFLVDGDNMQLDPLNPDTMTSLAGPNSVLKMPAYITPAEITALGDEGVTAGTMRTHTLESASLSQTRTFLVYEPPGQIIGEQLPTLYINDGDQYLTLIDTPAILDQLIAQRRIPPLIAVFIPPVLPVEDYTLNDSYARFLADELVPFIQENYGVNPSPQVTGILGSGLGGLAAVHAALTRPDVFGLVAGQSGNYAINDDALMRQVNSKRAGLANLEPLRLYLVVGNYETAVGGDQEQGNLLEANRRLAQALDNTNWQYLSEELPEGHSWGLWQGTIGRALTYLYG